MKKFLALLLAAIMCFALAGCNENKQKLNVAIHDNSINYGDTKEQIEKSVGDLIDTNESTMESKIYRSKKQPTVKIGNYEYSVSYLFDDKGKLINIRYLRDYDGKACDDLRKTLNLVLNEKANSNTESLDSYSWESENDKYRMTANCHRGDVTSLRLTKQLIVFVASHTK